MEDQEIDRARDAGIGVLVQPPAVAGADRLYPTRPKPRRILPSTKMGERCQSDLNRGSPRNEGFTGGCNFLDLTGKIIDMETTSALDELILEQAADAVVFANRQGVIERWNAAAAALFGYSDQEALGQSLDLVIPEHLRKAHWHGFHAATASGKTRLGGHPMRTRGLHKSGQKLYVEMSFALVADDTGAILGAVAIARDATERTERENATAGSADASS